MRNMPHTDVRVVIFFALLLISWFFRHIQFSKYNKAVKFLTTSAAANLPLKSGGTPQTLELHKRACELYDNHMKGGEWCASSSHCSIRLVNCWLIIVLYTMCVCSQRVARTSLWAG